MIAMYRSRRDESCGIKHLGWAKPKIWYKLQKTDLFCEKCTLSLSNFFFDNFFSNFIFISDNFMTEKVGISCYLYFESLKSMKNDSNTMLIIRGTKFKGGGFKFGTPPPLKFGTPTFYH